MNYKEILAETVTSSTYKDLFEAASNNLDEFQVVFELMFEKKEKIAWRAGWICEKVSEVSPHFFTESLMKRIIDLVVETPYAGLQRSLLSMVLNLGLPVDVSVDFINLSFDRMISPKSPISVQVLSMKVLYEFTKREPDLKRELKVYLESIDVNNYSVGYRSARKNILKKL